MLHLLFFTGSGGSNAARMASSKTFFNPFCNFNDLICQPCFRFLMLLTWWELQIPEWERNIRRIWQPWARGQAFRPGRWWWPAVYSWPISQRSLRRPASQFGFPPAGTASSGSDAWFQVPTETIKNRKIEYAPNRWEVASSTFSLTFSNEEGETTEKHTRKTSVCG